LVFHSILPFVVKLVSEYLKGAPNYLSRGLLADSVLDYGDVSLLDASGAMELTVVFVQHSI
jgi:hypothetical protein